MREASPRRASSTGIDFDRFRLRTFLAKLEQEGQIETIADPVPLSAIAARLDDNPKAVWFQQAGPEHASLVGNVVASRSRIASAFGVGPKELLPTILERLQNTPEIVEVPSAEAPVHQVIQQGDEVDVTRLPAHLQHGRDGGPYISAAMDFSFDPDSGLTNVGLRRLMLRGRRETGIDLLAVSDLRTIYQATVARGESLPLSIVVGSNPIDYFGSIMRLPIDELGLLSSLRGAPLPVVKCLTNDLRVPADAEYVIEGYLDSRGYIEAEGPYGEFLGYYGGVKTNPVFKVTAITRRRDAIFQTMSISGHWLHRTDTANLNALRTEVLVWRMLQNAVREPLAVYCPPGSGGIYNCRIAMRQRQRGEARNAISAVMGSLANVKNVYVVDPDIDIFSDEQMEWALATRFQPQRDLVVNGNFRSTPLDPSLDGSHTGSKAGYDLTMPFGRESLELTVPQPPTYDGPRFASIRAALLDGPRSFEELMAATESDDGREIVLSLDEIRERGELSRNREDGRYVISAGSDQA